MQHRNKNRPGKSVKNMPVAKGSQVLNMICLSVGCNNFTCNYASMWCFCDVRHAGNECICEPFPFSRVLSGI